MKKKIAILLMLAVVVGSYAYVFAAQSKSQYGSNINQASVAVLNNERSDITTSEPIKANIAFLTKSSNQASNQIRTYGGHHGYYANSGGIVDPEKEKESYLVYLEAEKSKVKSLYENGNITKERYDLIIADIQATIDYVSENGLNYNAYGENRIGHHGNNYGGGTVDQETAKEYYLANLEAEKAYVNSLYSNNSISKEQYDLAISNIQSVIDYVSENGLPNNMGTFGGHHW